MTKKFTKVLREMPLRDFTYSLYKNLVFMFLGFLSTVFLRQTAWDFDHHNFSKKKTIFFNKSGAFPTK